MKNLGWVVVVVFGAMVGCASTGTGRASTLSAERGTILVPGSSVKAVVVGPRVIHAFASGTGGGLFTVPASDHADRDCAAAMHIDGRRAVAIARDQRIVFVVGAGQIACLATSGTRDFELLWHATDQPVPGPVSEPSDTRVAMVGSAR